MTNGTFLEQLRALETALHQSDVRRDPARLDELIHESFVEFGRSGRIYSRKEIVDSMWREAAPVSVWSQDFAVTEIAPDVVLLTYRSANMDENGGLDRHAVRSSLWQRSRTGWQVRFHQGTPTAAFEKRGT